MHLQRRIGVFCSMSVLALALAAGPVHAQCVKFDGLEHCPIGAAKLSVGASGLKVSNFGASGADGVSINFEQTSSWSAEYNAAAFSAPSQEVLFTSAAEGYATATATLGISNAASGACTKSLAATFTGAGSLSTYSVLVYKGGVLQAALGGVPSGQVAARSIGGGPGCRPRYQSYAQCMQICTTGGWPCGYCSNPCPPDITHFRTLANSACRWEFSGALQTWQLSDGSTVEGDLVVLNEEVQENGSYPYLGFDEIRIQGTPNWVDLFSESIIQH